MAFTYKEMLIPESKYSLKAPYSMNAEFLVVHNTANKTSAESEVTYMTNNSTATSFHVAVDNKFVIKAIPFWRNAFHAGDGANGPGNRKGIGIEICYSTSDLSLFSKAEENAAIYIAELLEELNWGIDKVTKHQDFSGKYCPHRTLDLGWERFLKMIETHMKAKKETNNSIYRIRKEWNDGKWTNEQKGAYTSYETALANFTNEYKSEGYKIFSPKGQILYPLDNDTHPLAEQMKKDGVTEDVAYWSKCLSGQEPLNLEYISTIINRYSKKLNNEEEKEFYLVNNTYIFPIDINKFKILYFDKPKTQSKELTYCNLGFFGNFVENKVKFTLPCGNLVADINEAEVSPEALQYLKQRKIANGKLYFSANQNSSLQFKRKNVSTLIIENGMPRVEKINQVQETFDYAVSGVPVICAGQPAVSYKSEGWSGGENRATYHGFLGIKENKLYYFPMYTTTNDCITSQEVYNRVKDFGFSDVIKVDGGGSAHFVRNGEVQMTTSENRQINNIAIF